MSQIMNSFGVKVDVVAKDPFLNGIIDDDITNIWEYNARLQGLNILWNTAVTEVQKLNDNN